MGTIWNTNREEVNQWNKAWNFNDHDEFIDWFVIVKNKFAFSKWSQSFTERYSNGIGHLYDMRKYLFLKLEMVKNEKRVALTEQATLYTLWMKSIFRRRYYKKQYFHKSLIIENALQREKFYEDCIYIIDKMLKKQSYHKEA